MRKKDEMEQKIANKAMRISWFSTILLLFIMDLVLRFNGVEGRSIFSIIAVLSVVLTIVLERYYLSKINEDNSFSKFIVAIIVLIFFFFGISILVSFL